MPAARSAHFEDLRAKVRALEQADRRDGEPRRGPSRGGGRGRSRDRARAKEVATLDAALPGGGLALGALHEVAGGGDDAVGGAAAALFAAGIVARLPGPVLWCITRPDLFAPALSHAGLGPDRVIYVEAGDEKALMACFEEGLRHGGLAGQPPAAATRWRVSAEPSVPLPVPGIGRARWRIELMRCRGADAADFILDACDETGRLAFPAELARRSVAPPAGRRRATA